MNSHNADIPPAYMRTDSRWSWIVYLILFCAMLLAFGRCSNPLDGDEKKNIIVNPIDNEPDDPSLDTAWAHVSGRIRFEAIIDKQTFTYQRIPDSMRVGIVTERRTDSIPYREIYSTSAAYLNVTSVILPLEAEIPPSYFIRWKNARLFFGYIIVYVDRNKSKSYDYGETIYGMSEQAVFGFAEGKKLSNVPKKLVDYIQEGLNAMIRTGGEKYAASFTASPDFDATVFKIQIRGTGTVYNIPYPWKPTVELIP